MNWSKHDIMRRLETDTTALKAEINDLRINQKRLDDEMYHTRGSGWQYGMSVADNHNNTQSIGSPGHTHTINDITDNHYFENDMRLAMDKMQRRIEELTCEVYVLRNGSPKVVAPKEEVVEKPLPETFEESDMDMRL